MTTEQSTPETQQSGTERPEETTAEFIAAGREAVKNWQGSCVRALQMSEEEAAMEVDSAFDTCRAAGKLPEALDRLAAADRENARYRAREAVLVKALERVSAKLEHFDYFSQADCRTDILASLSDCPPAASAPDDLATLANEVRAWRAATFPDCSEEAVILKLIEETEELLRNPRDPMEQADVWIMLTGIPGLADAVRAKHEVNKRRRWRQDASGAFRHVADGEAGE